MTVTAAHHHHTSPIVENASAAIAAGHCERHLLWQGEEDTEAFARQLSALPDLRDAFLTLHGELGAGKTTLVRHLLRALGVQGRIKSPTYAVVEPYEVAGLHIWHFDFYRFDDPQEWEDAGFRDIFASPGIKLAEWPQKAQSVIPPADWAIHLEVIDETQRRVMLCPGTQRGRRMMLHWPQ